MGGFGGEIEVAEVYRGGMGYGGIGVIRRRVQNGSIDVIERRVWIKDWPGKIDEMVILYARSSFAVQSLPDFADRIILAIAVLKSEDVIRTP